MDGKEALRCDKAAGVVARRFGLGSVCGFRDCSTIAATMKILKANQPMHTNRNPALPFRPQAVSRVLDSLPAFYSAVR